MKTSVAVSKAADEVVADSLTPSLFYTCYSHVLHMYVSAIFSCMYLSLPVYHMIKMCKGTSICGTSESGAGEFFYIYLFF